MKMAAASQDECLKACEFVRDLEDMLDSRASDKEIAKFVRDHPPLFRIVFGYAVLKDNLCKDSSGTLELDVEKVKPLLNEVEAK